MGRRPGSWSLLQDSPLQSTISHFKFDRFLYLAKESYENCKPKKAIKIIHFLPSRIILFRAMIHFSGRVVKRCIQIDFNFNLFISNEERDPTQVMVTNEV